MTDREKGADPANDMADAHAQTPPNPDPSGDSMPEKPSKGDHWNHLASVLGAEVREEPPLPESQEPRAENEAAKSPEPLATPPPAKPDKPRRPTEPPNWDALATSLGVELPQQPVIEQPASGLESQRDEEAAEPTMSTEQLAETVDNLSEFLRSAPASLGHEPTVVIAEETVAVIPKPVEVDAEESDEDGRREEPAPGRPKHRRRRSRADQRQAAPAHSDAAPGADVDPEDDDAVGDAEAEETRRSKRRRPRRRRQKSNVSEAKAEPEAESDEPDTADDLDSDGHQESGGKMGHRSIPAWREAIGIIVEKNLESRSTKPPGGQSTKRGGRRSGRRGRG